MFLGDSRTPKLAEDDQKAREDVVDLAALPPGGGRGAIGWSEKRFFGRYERYEGVGDDRFSWAVSGANLVEATDDADADKDKKKDEKDKKKDKDRHAGGGGASAAGDDDGADEEAKRAEEAMREVREAEEVARFVELRYNAAAQKRRNIEPLRFRAAKKEGEEAEDDGGAASAADAGYWLDGDARDFVWRDGTVIGCGVELTELDVAGSFAAKFQYFVNDKRLKCNKRDAPELVAIVNDGLVPAVTCHANMRVAFNFGEQKFKFEDNARGYDAVSKSLESAGTVKKSAANKKARRPAATSASAGSRGRADRPVRTSFTASRMSRRGIGLLPDALEAGGGGGRPPGATAMTATGAAEAGVEWKEGLPLIDGLSSPATKKQLQRLACALPLDGGGKLDLKGGLGEENPVKEMRQIVQFLLRCPHARLPETCVRKISVDANVLLGADGVQELAIFLEVGGAFVCVCSFASVPLHFLLLVPPFESCASVT